jgi:hypothetical protein
MSELHFPSNSQNPEDLADWLELVALRAADANASAGELERELNRLNNDKTESLLGNVFNEFDRRKNAVGSNGYPFLRDNTSIEFDRERRGVAYVFCLALSFFGWKTRKGAEYNPWLLFEKICTESAASYLHGKSILFGTGSRVGRKGKSHFKTNIAQLAVALGEGEDFRPQKTFSTKDSKLDVVAWKPFSDGRASQVILFGQCSAGTDWADKKLNELDPDAFWDQWMKRGKVSSLLRSVFIPHRVFDNEEWELRARRARLLFDRCRVAAHAHDRIRDTALENELMDCCLKEWGLNL